VVLDQNAEADAWAMTPSGACGVLNNAISIHLADATIASAFVARWYQKNWQRLIWFIDADQQKGGLSRRWCA
jgi:hypothetical protein